MSDEQNLQPEQTDVEKNKVYAVLAYLIFFIPLLAAKDSKFATYHANQGLILFLAALIINVAGSIIPVIGWFLILPLGDLAILVLAIMGILKAVNGQMAPLPLIGKFTIIK
ncbi:MAG TPA: hypothetical protein VNU93_08615 [Verrucomicrobiae bacterium]|nr:hypothetical protein [Verrucomicrobiae bacterium]